MDRVSLTNTKGQTPADTGSELASAIGGRVAWARLRRKITQKELAQRIDKARVTIVQYEKGAIVPPIDVLGKIAEVLDVSPAFLAFGSTEHDAMRPLDGMVAIPEIRLTNDEEAVSGKHVVPVSMLVDLGVDPSSFDDIKAYILPMEARAFELPANARLYVDTSIRGFVSGRKFYVLRTVDGIDVVRSEPNHLRSREVTFTCSTGSMLTYEAEKIDFVGAMVGAMMPS